MGFLTVKGWADFQHYKDRSPPWIKLHKSLLDNYEYQCLPIASRALAPMIWLLASESNTGVFDGDAKKLAFRLRATEKEIIDGLNPLIQAGFLISDSSLLADCKPDAMPEREREKRRDKEKVISPPIGFAEFWSAYDKKTGKAASIKEWEKARPDADLVTKIVSAAAGYASRTEQKYRKDPERWLKGRMWEDEGVGEQVSDSIAGLIL